MRRRQSQRPQMPNLVLGVRQELLLCHLPFFQPSAFMRSATGWPRSTHQAKKLALASRARAAAAPVLLGAVSAGQADCGE